MQRLADHRRRGSGALEKRGTRVVGKAEQSRGAANRTGHVQEQVGEGGRYMRPEPLLPTNAQPLRWTEATGSMDMSNTLPQPSPVEAAVLNRLAHVLRLEVGRPFEVGQVAGDLENPWIRPRGQGEPRDRLAQQCVGAVRHAAE